MAGDERAELAPEYRYFTADLLTNEILAEIPFRGVSYGRAVKGAGEFQGKIPVIPDTENLDLYETTMPGKTALYVVRNNECVWGGVIWNRQYEVTSRDLSITAAEFTSYFYRRMIWKTWNHEYGATLIVSGGEAKVVYDYGSNTLVEPGSSVHIDFYEPSNFQYNGYYRVSGSPAPTLAGFEVVGGTAIADVSSVEVHAGVATINTVSNHGFNTGDLITLDTQYGAPFDGTFEIIADGGSETKVFSFVVSSGDITRTADAGTAVRPVPDGVYQSVTVAVRADTWDYVRNLIDSVFTDFVGTDFPNVYIEPGVSYGLDVTAKKLDGGYATITTAQDHNLAVGQAVQIKDVGSNFNGEFEVTGTPFSDQFMYKAGGTLTETAVSPIQRVVTGVSLANNIATLTTSAAHGFVVGNTVNVFAGYDFEELNGDQVITAIPTTTTFQYSVYSNNQIPSKTLPVATATSSSITVPIVAAKIQGNVATLTAGADITGYTPGQTVTVANVNRFVEIKEKSLDAANSVATITTVEPHGVSSGTAVEIDGLSDVSPVVRKKNTTTTVTMTTNPPHNFKVGSVVDIDDMLDVYPLSNKALTSNVATLTTQYPHNLGNGSTVTVESLVDNYTITNKMLSNNVATITTSINHNFPVNSEITIAGVVDTATVVSKTAENGVAILTMSAPHNFLEAEEVTISGVGAPFDGKFSLLAVTATRIFYEIENTSVILPAKSGGTATGSNSIFNGTFTVSATTSNTVSFVQVGNDIFSQSASGTLSGLSIMNGVRTVTGVTSTTFTFSLAANNIPSATVPVADEEGEIQAVVYRPSIHSGARTITAVTRNTFTFSQSSLVSDDVPRDVLGLARMNSIFNGVRTVTAATEDTLQFSLSAVSNVYEQVPLYPATIRLSSIYSGSFTLTGVDPVTRTFTYAKTYQNLENRSVRGQGTAVVRPTAIISSFGPYPGNADIGLSYSTRKYSGTNVEPIAYRGYELTNVGEALDKYSDSINGFEYRVDCAFDADTQSFTKTFVLIPIDFPNPPAPGETSDVSRFGADKLVFEYPGGSITDLQLAESADESSTRFFAQGDSDLGVDIGPNVSIASAEDLLSGEGGERRWPLLDASEKIDAVDDESELYAYAKRYLSETRPPDARFTVSVNGSIPPLVGTYAPGQWCSLIIDDAFIHMRLASKLEPRDDVIVRKIESFKVSVPDGVTFPEKVALTLVAEWEVDKRG